MERLEPLLYKDYMIWQDPELGCFTRDSVLLAHYTAKSAHIRPDTRCIDLCCGNGILALYCQALMGGSFVGVDINERQLALAGRSAEKNNQAIDFLCMDVADSPKQFGHGTFELCVCNPPYFTQSAESPGRDLWRHGDTGLWQVLMHSAFLLLKNGGRFFMCCPAALLSKALCELSAARLEPKNMELVCSRKDGIKAKLCLIEAVKLGKIGMNINCVQGQTDAIT